MEENVYAIFDEASNMSKGSTPNDEDDSMNPLKVLEEYNEGDNDVDSQGSD